MTYHLEAFPIPSTQPHSYKKSMKFKRMQQDPLLIPSTTRPKTHLEAKTPPRMTTIISHKILSMASTKWWTIK
jgi:hypothetical protein